MLTEIQIENLALIKSCSLELPAGFIAVTGETGAGKSMFISALKLLAGNKMPASIIRKDEEKATVRGFFEVPTSAELQQWLKDRDIDTSEGELVVERQINANGKNRSRLNGTPLSIAELQELSTWLIQLQGQSEQSQLKDIRTHLLWLDTYASLQPLREQYEQALRTWQHSRHLLDTKKEALRQLAIQRDFLQFQHKELSQIKLQKEDEEKLEDRLKELQESIRSAQLRNEFLQILSDGSGSMQEKSGILQKKLGKLPLSMQEALNPGLETLNQALEELTSILLSKNTQSSFPEREVDEINQTLAFVQSLKRKYKCDFAALLALRDERAHQLEQLESSDLDLAELEATEKNHAELLVAKGLELEKERRSATQSFCDAIQHKIRSLGMPGASVSIQFTATSSALMVETTWGSAGCGRMGLFDLEFIMETNTGEGWKPLRTTLSGGELSRMLLVIKSLLASKDQVPVLVFDEIDSGISGEIAHKLAEEIARLGDCHQVFSITHLHQVASRASYHIKVEKQEEQQRTISKARLLSKEERVQEIGRMMGSAQSEDLLRHAEELIG
jgi:DNA repair protein RecN (Recombination protein N)